ncbi:Rv3654c family TadE-like protein [Mycobacteroides chelonae]|uniref:Rv3654c family TadE-like protein n=1 Tax=Mycobacteroides chelonae TaxID=1774 RepID=UPI00307861BA
MGEEPHTALLLAARWSRFGTTVTTRWRGLPREAFCCLPLRLPPNRSQRWNPRAEEGSATIVAAAIIVVLLALTAGGAAVGSAVVARHRAQAAADLSALAGAQRALYGTVSACAEATVVARRTGAAVTSCMVDDLDVVVAVSVPVMLGRFGMGPARAAARAGPVAEVG